MQPDMQLTTRRAEEAIKAGTPLIEPEANHTVARVYMVAGRRKFAVGAGVNGQVPSAPEIRRPAASR